MGSSEQAGYFPARPGLTIVFVCSVAFWALCAVGYSAGDVRETGACVNLAVAGGAVAALGGIASLVRRMRAIGLVVLAAAVGFSLGSAQAARMHDVSMQLEGTADERVEFTLLEDSMDYGFGETALVKGRMGNCPEEVFSARLGSVGPLLCGQRVTGNVKFTAIDYASDSYAWSEGSCGKVALSDCEVLDSPQPLSALIAFRSRVIDAIGGDDEQHALLQALVCGYRRNVDGTELYARFQACGLAHLVAVSGAHLVIVTGLFASLLKRFNASRRLTIGMLVVAMASYFVVAGMPVSALRAMAISALGLASFFGKRRASSLNALGIVIFGMLAFSPATSVSVSFALSALSTMGIVLFASLFLAWFEQTPLARAPFAIDALSLTAGASVLSQLYSCSLFNQLPLVSPLANVVSAPLFPIVCGAGLLASLVAAAFPGWAGVAVNAPGLAAGALSSIVGLLSGLPYASIPFSIDTVPALLISGGLALLLWALWPRSAFRAAVAFCSATLTLAVVFAVTADRSDSITMLDVGQGDAILVRSRGSTLLIDTGNQDSKLVEELAKNRIVHLDSMLITHADDDHCGSLDALQKTVSVDRVIMAEGMTACAGDSAMSLVEEASRTATGIVGLSAGDRFEVGAFKAHVVWPREFVEEGGNADSLCVMLEYDGNEDGEVDFRALMTGDAEKDELAEMISSGVVGDIDILKVGHHGSRNGSTADEIRVLHPEVALISCGAHNRYGHPTQEILDQLSEVGAATFRTDRDGEIKCTLTPDGISVARIE